MLTETRERFLVAIAAQVPAERIAEIHFFQPIRQGGIESGVAVVVERGAAVAVPDDAIDAVEAIEIDALAIETEAEPADEPRIVVYTALYRLTLKGMDRGKWETSVIAQADAPLVAVDAVVRGVQRRAGDLDDATRMEGDEVRTFLDARRPAARTPAPA